MGESRTSPGEPRPRPHAPQAAAASIRRRGRPAGSGRAVLAAQRGLAESAGGTYHQLADEDIPAALLAFAHAHNATQLMPGATPVARGCVSPGEVQRQPSTYAPWTCTAAASRSRPGHQQVSQQQRPQARRRQIRHRSGLRRRRTTTRWQRAQLSRQAGKPVKRNASGRQPGGVLADRGGPRKNQKIRKQPCTTHASISQIVLGGRPYRSSSWPRQRSWSPRQETLRRARGQHPARRPNRCSYTS
jgi:hypothetical protein